ncbi:2TM domain-containing protein [Costertonia aggregata]|uniref:2TM domain-containing protein n=1 Tax=Costertonia aggregata TaxID=343403 RepID=A0A7H9AKK9_9FLAO|nr:2TM domain-containing protein [Costertonia aggregata]QLG44011.1 2TM domain-containing protein [Costertonia aggregata]
MENKDQNNKYFRAKERVADLKKFYGKITSGLIAIGITGGINYYLNEWEYPWFLWVVFGVSIGLIFRAIKLFSLNPFMGKDWEERKIKEFMKKDEKQERWN